MGSKKTVVIKSLFCGGNSVATDSGSPIQIDRINHDELGYYNLDKSGDASSESATDDDMTRSCSSNDHEQLVQHEHVKERQVQVTEEIERDRFENDKEGEFAQRPLHNEHLTQLEDQEPELVREQEQEQEQDFEQEQEQNKLEQEQELKRYMCFEIGDEESTESTFKSFDIEFCPSRSDIAATCEMDDAISTLGMSCAFDGGHKKGRRFNKKGQHERRCRKNPYQCQCDFHRQNYQNKQVDRSLFFHSLRQQRDDLGLIQEEEKQDETQYNVAQTRGTAEEELGTSMRPVAGDDSSSGSIDEESNCQYSEYDTFAEELARLAVQIQNKSFGVFDFHSVATAEDPSNNIISVCFGDIVENNSNEQSPVEGASDQVTQVKEVTQPTEVNVQEHEEQMDAQQQEVVGEDGGNAFCRTRDNYACPNAIRVDRIFSTKTQQRYKDLQEKIHEERSYWVSTVSALASTYGKNHVKTAEGLMHLGDAYVNTKDYSKSIATFQSAIQIWESLTHSSGSLKEKKRQKCQRKFQVAIAKALDRIGLAYLLQLCNCYNNDNHNTAMCSPKQRSPFTSQDRRNTFHASSQRKVLAGSSSFLQPQHRDPVSASSSSSLLSKTVNRIGLAWTKITTTFLKEKNKHVMNALNPLLKAFEIRMKEFGPLHVDTVDTYNKIAACYLQLHDYGKALEAYLEIHTVRNAIFGPNHPSVAVSAQALGYIYSTMGPEQQDWAVSFYQSALDIYQNEMNLPHDHPTIVLIHQDLKSLSLR